MSQVKVYAVGAVLVAVGAYLLVEESRASGRKSVRTRAPAPLAVAPAPGVAESDAVVLRAALDHGIVRADASHDVVLKVGLTGVRRGTRRAPVNVAFVIDRSGSMKGEKLAQAKSGAIQAIRSLGPDDVVSVIAFSDRPQQVVPPGKLLRPQQAVDAIEALAANGQTALHAGVMAGAAAARTFAAGDRISRVVLLSDGLANVGPSTPQDVAVLGAALAAEGITVTSMGLGNGYNEDLLTRLAEAGGGNHMFVWGAPYLAEAVRQEMEDVLSATVQAAEVEVTCRNGVRADRVLNKTGAIQGTLATAVLGQVRAGQEEYLLLQLRLPPAAAGTTLHAADVTVTYTNAASGRRERLVAPVELSYSHSTAAVAASANSDVLVAASLQEGIDRNRLATELRDGGRIDEAREVLEASARSLETSADAYGSAELADLAGKSAEDAENLGDETWEIRRKMMRAVWYDGQFVQSPEGIQKS